jgi:hypothetical protein
MRARRPALACALAACLAASGCGGGSEEERTGSPAGTGDGAPAAEAVPPESTPQPLDYTAGARPALERGAIGVVDVTNRVGVAPAAMDVNKQQRVSRLRWAGWGASRTTGRGRVRTLVCEPTCAGGRIESSTAVIVLSAPRRCRGGRFYTRSSMTYEEQSTGRTRAPATYLRTPPC